MFVLRSLIAVVVVFLAFCAGCLIPPSFAGAAANDTDANKSLSIFKRHMVKSIKVGKIRRSYVINLPKHQSVKPAPVIVVLHGALSNSMAVAWDTRMTERANEHGFIVVYPRGIGIATALRTWNAGDCCGIAKLKNIDDIAFLKALIGKIRADYNVDADRIYMAGASNGGMMAYRAAIEMSDQIAAIATASGTMMTSERRAGDPVSVLVFHGTKDKIVPYNGGLGGLPFWKITGTKVADNVKFWVERDQCSEKGLREEVGNYVKETYPCGRNGTEVCVYTVKKGKHNWPGGRATFIRNDPEMGKLDATDIICKFFLSHPKVRTLN